MQSLFSEFANLCTTCNAVSFYTTGFESFSAFILDCWSIINFIVNDDILNLRLLWLDSGARHFLCDAHFSSYMYAFRLDQQKCFKCSHIVKFPLEQVRFIPYRIDVTCAPFSVLIMLYLSIIFRIDDYLT